MKSKKRKKDKGNKRNIDIDNELPLQEIIPDKEEEKRKRDQDFITGKKILDEMEEKDRKDQEKEEKKERKNRREKSNSSLKFSDLN